MITVRNPWRGPYFLLGCFGGGILLEFHDSGLAVTCETFPIAPEWSLSSLWCFMLDLFYGRGTKKDTAEKNLVPMYIISIYLDKYDKWMIIDPPRLILMILMIFFCMFSRTCDMSWRRKQKPFSLPMPSNFNHAWFRSWIRKEKVLLSAWNELFQSLKVAKAYVKPNLKFISKKSWWTYESISCQIEIEKIREYESLTTLPSNLVIGSCLRWTLALFCNI